MIQTTLLVGPPDRRAGRAQCNTTVSRFKASYPSYLSLRPIRGVTLTRAPSALHRATAPPTSLPNHHKNCLFCYNSSLKLIRVQNGLIFPLLQFHARRSFVPGNKHTVILTLHVCNMLKCFVQYNLNLHANYLMYKDLPVGSGFFVNLIYLFLLQFSYIL